MNAAVLLCLAGALAAADDVWHPPQPAWWAETAAREPGDGDFRFAAGPWRVQVVDAAQAEAARAALANGVPESAKPVQDGREWRASAADSAGRVVLLARVLSAGSAGAVQLVARGSGALRWGLGGEALGTADDGAAQATLAIAPGGAVLWLELRPTAGREATLRAEIVDATVRATAKGWAGRAAGGDPAAAREAGNRLLDAGEPLAALCWYLRAQAGGAAPEAERLERAAERAIAADGDAARLQALAAGIAGLGEARRAQAALRLLETAGAASAGSLLQLAWSPGARAQVLAAGADAAWRAGNGDAARAWAQEGLLLRPLPDERAAAQADRIATSLLDEGRIAEALAAARRAWDAAADERQLETATRTMMRAVKAAQGGLPAVHAWLAFQRHGPTGADGAPGTADDLVDPLPAPAPLAPPPAEVLAGFGGGADGWRLRGYCLLRAGRAAEALAAFRTAFAVCAVQDDALARHGRDVVVALKAVHGHLAAGEAFIAWQRFGAAGADGRTGTGDDLADPLAERR